MSPDILPIMWRYGKPAIHALAHRPSREARGALSATTLQDADSGTVPWRT